MEAQYYTNVCGVFVTFENDADVRKMAELICCHQKSSLRIFGGRIEIIRPKEPSNYIWENLAYTRRRKVTLFVIIFLLIMLLLYLAYKV